MEYMYGFEQPDGIVLYRRVKCHRGNYLVWNPRQIVRDNVLTDEPHDIASSFEAFFAHDNGTLNGFVLSRMDGAVFARSVRFDIELTPVVV
jgi:hypothetical protein